MELSDEVLLPSERVSYALRSSFHDAGYTRFRMGKFEEYDLYARNKQFLVDDNVITFTDKGGRLMALKPDVTLSIIKSTRDGEQSLRKVYYDENVYRIPKGADSFREITQIGLECIGSVNLEVLCEVVSLAVESLHAISSEAVLEISHMGVVSAVMDALSLGFAARKRVLSALEQRSAHALEALQGQLGIDGAKANLLPALLAAYGRPGDVRLQLGEALSGFADGRAWDGFSELLQMLEQRGLSEDVRVNFSLVNDADYYDGLVFTGFVAQLPSRVLSGGQYDGLMRSMKRDAQGVGFAVYLNGVDELEDRGDAVGLAAKPACGDRMVGGEVL